MIQDEPIRIVSMDPGMKNYAVTIMDVTFSGGGSTFKKLKHEPQGVHIDIIKTGLLKNPMFDINTDLVIQNRLFAAEVDRIIVKYNPVMIIAERFQNRGFRAGGAQIEVVNLMLGALLSSPKVDEIDLKLISPMVWKNSMKKQFDLKGFYKKCRFPVHEFDSTLIGIYGAALYAGIKIVNVQLSPQQIMASIELKTRSKLKKKRKKVEDDIV